MCGLIGTCGPGAVPDLIDPQALLGHVKHRGPDGHGSVFVEDAWLGHTRLAIQDITRGLQPWETDHITLTYNGELWNADQIDVGPCSTTCDTEVVALALEQYGEQAVPRFDGMFAMVWHDRRDGLIRMTRDRWGKVPLYLANDGGTATWASEYGALPYGLPADAVLPGHLLTIQPGTSWLVDDWHWSADSPIPYRQPSPAAVLHLLRKGVRERLVGDRSIGYMLSGGLDSSLILALAADEAPGRVVAYTAVLDSSAADLVAARKIAAELGIPLVEVPVPPVTMARVAEAVQVVEIPHKAQVEIALAHLPVMARISADGHAVCLSGEAADELFGGYGNTQIQASKLDDAHYSLLKVSLLDKMARGNFSRVNKVGMRHGVECRLPFMQSELVELAVNATKAESPPGKILLKNAARLYGLPEWVIRQPKRTFQGDTGTADAAAAAGFGLREYNSMARGYFGFRPVS